jgi:hypothetical protein
MGFAGHVACMGEMRGAYGVLMCKARDHVENIGLYGSIILKLFFNN